MENNMRSRTSENDALFSVLEGENGVGDEQHERERIKELIKGFEQEEIKVSGTPATQAQQQGEQLPLFSLQLGDASLSSRHPSKQRSKATQKMRSESDTYSLEFVDIEAEADDQEQWGFVLPTDAPTAQEHVQQAHVQEIPLPAEEELASNEELQQLEDDYRRLEQLKTSLESERERIKSEWSIIESKKSELASEQAQFEQLYQQEEERISAAIKAKEQEKDEEIQELLKKAEEHLKSIKQDMQEKSKSGLTAIQSQLSDS